MSARTYCRNPRSACDFDDQFPMPERNNPPPQNPRRGRAERAVLIACACHLILLALISIANFVGPDRWWISGLNMYLPQWIWGLPILGLFPLSLWLARRWFWVPL